MLTRRRPSRCSRRGRVELLAPAGALLLALALPSVVAAKAPDPPVWSIAGRVVFPGSLRGRPVRVDVSKRFPFFGSAGEQSVAVEPNGHFAIKMPSGAYWVVAYVDDNRDGRRSPGEICGFAHVAPVEVGPRHRRLRLRIDLDPVHAILATRFSRGDGAAKARLEEAFVAVYVRRPATGAPLEDAVVTVERDGQVQRLTYDPSFPGGAFVAFGDGRTPAERYVFHVEHPALGKKPRRVILHRRSFGAEPTLVGPKGARVRAGQDLTVEWRQPPWANFAFLELFAPDPAGGLQRRWPADLAQRGAAESPAVVPAAALSGAGRLRLEVVAGRADVRAENGEIWATGRSGCDLTVEPARGATKSAGKR